MYICVHYNIYIHTFITIIIYLYSYTIKSVVGWRNGQGVELAIKRSLV